MPKYSYIVVNKENKELNGNINAPDEATARKELNALGFSILGITLVPDDSVENAVEVPENIVKYEFSATDKAGKNIIGTIQGEDLYAVYKRLLLEYQFDVHFICDSRLDEASKEKQKVQAILELKDRLEEEKMAAEAKTLKTQIDQQEFAIRQASLKKMVEFVLQKVNTFLTQYAADIKVEHKAKIKYYVDKILRIRNSTNLEYIKESCQDLLKYIQEQELFIHTDLHLRDRSIMTLEARSMMTQIKAADKKKQKDIFEEIQKWRQEKIVGKQNVPLYFQIVNSVAEIFLGSAEVTPEKQALLEELNNTNSQLKSFLVIYFETKEKEIKNEAWMTLLRLWQNRKKIKQDLRKLETKLKQAELAATEYTLSELIFIDFYRLAGWVFVFYLIYYFLSIYLTTKQLQIPLLQRLPLIFQTSFIKYFFILLFLFICFAGIKIEFFKRKKWADFPLMISYALLGLILTLNF